MSSNIITVLGTEQTFELPADITVCKHNGGWNINICDSNAKDRTNPLGIVFSVCTKGSTDAEIAQSLVKGLKQIGAQLVNANV